jgi:diguanylate cyclase (GGDEF)-like protein
MNEQLAAKIKDAPDLPSVPAIALQVLEMAQKPEVDIAEIARVISRDPALSSKILRTVNSSFYGRSNNVGTISHALVILGLQSVKTLVLGFSLVANITKSKPRGFDHVGYWKRSIFAATAARALAARVGLVQQEEAFLASLLADIGMLALDQILGEAYGQVCATAAASHEALCAAEQAALGATHAQVSGLLAEMWKLPVTLAVPIANHHAPDVVTDPALRKLAELVQLAGRAADVFVDADAAPAIADVRKICAARHQLTDADCDTILADIGKRTQEVAGLFELSLASPEEYEAILKRANAALVALTLQTQQQAKSLAAQANKLSARASTLQQRNEQLRRQATTDALTGLANRARFDEFVADELRRAMGGAAPANSTATAPAPPTAQRPLALLLLDLDHFKQVNDRFGHQAGDAVLRAVGRVMNTIARAADLAARYGGEEMALVLPDTTRAAAAKIAETLRRAIAARAVPAGTTHVKVTASVGMAVWEPGSPLVTPAHLIRAADLAVYNAKRAGRNRVKICTLGAPTALEGRKGESAAAEGAIAPPALAPGPTATPPTAPPEAPPPEAPPPAVPTPPDASSATVKPAA